VGHLLTKVLYGKFLSNFTEITACIVLKTNYKRMCCLIRFFLQLGPLLAIGSKKATREEAEIAKPTRSLLLWASCGEAFGIWIIKFTETAFDVVVNGASFHALDEQTLTGFPEMQLLSHPHTNSVIVRRCANSESIF
jgi:hypothetical protein